MQSIFLNKRSKQVLNAVLDPKFYSSKKSIYEKYIILDHTKCDKIFAFGWGGTYRFEPVKIGDSKLYQRIELV